jgi:multimeric flavodoxin WrbA
MQSSIINGSQKPGESNTGIILKELGGPINGNHMIINHVPGSKKFSPEIYRGIAASDVILLGFSLYIDSVPSNMLKTLAVLEEYIKKAPSQGIAAYAIINNGFYEGRQTRTAFEIVQNWCDRAGPRCGGGIGQGAGEMLGAVKNIPMSKGPFSKLGRELALLARTIESKKSFGIKYLSPYFPRFL